VPNVVITKDYEAGGIYNQKPYYSGLTGSKYIWANPSGLYLISPTIGSSTSALYNSTTTGSVPGAYQSLVTGTCSVSIYTGSSVTFDYDDGTFSFASAPPSGSEITVDYSYTSIPDSQVQSLLNQSDEELEDLTARNFDLTTTSEYIDVEDRQTVFWLRNYPVVSMIGLSENTANSITDSPSWSASTEGIGNDYLMDANDKLVGTFEYIDNKPIKGSKRLYATYSYGYATIPDMVVELNNLLTLRKMINSTIYKSIYTGQDGYSPVRLDEIENRINALVTKLRKQGINRI